MEKDKNLIWKFKWIFLKGLTIISFLILLIYILSYIFYKLVLYIIEHFGSLILSTSEYTIHFIRSFYFSIPLSLLIFYLINKKYVNSITKKELNKLTEIKIFLKELKYFFNSIVIVNTISILYFCWDKFQLIYDSEGIITNVEGVGYLFIILSLLIYYFVWFIIFCGEE